MATKLLFLCSDPSVFNISTKYALKDKYKVYSSEECREMKDEDKKAKLSSCNLVIIDVINHKDDLKIINLTEWKKIVVLRNHESRHSSWFNNAYLKCDAVCKYKDQGLLCDFKDADTLIKNLQAVELDVEGDYRFYLKKFLRWFLFCLNQSS